jgi:hypothetical protein
MNRARPSNAANIPQRLQEWNDRLPKALSDLRIESPRANAHLRFQYHVVWMQLGQAGLIQRVRRNLGLSAKLGFLVIGQEGDADGHEISSQAVKSAYTIVAIIDYLRTREQLAQFSYTDFFACAYATVVIILHSFLDPMPEAAQRVSVAITALRDMASGNLKAKAGLQYIESLLPRVSHALQTLRGGSTRQFAFDERSPKDMAPQFATNATCSAGGDAGMRTASSTPADLSFDTTQQAYGHLATIQFFQEVGELLENLDADPHNLKQSTLRYVP